MIELSHVTKTYAPRLGPAARAIDDVSLRVAAGEVAGIAGPAGAGKSTLLAMVLGYTLPTTGTVRLDGIEPRSFVEREGVAYLPDRPAIPPRWRVVDALARLATLSGIPAAAARERVDVVIETLGLADRRHRRVGTLSLDERKRLGIAQAILAERRVVVLDEPLDGLEPDSVERFHDLVWTLRAPDRAILIASRDTAELQRVAHRVTIIDRGRVRRVGVPRGTTPVDVDVVFHLVVHHGAEHVSGVFPFAISVGRGTFAVRVADLATLNRGLRELLERGVLLASVAPADATAEPHPFAMTIEGVS